MLPCMNKKSIHIQISTNIKENLLTANNTVKEQGHMQNGRKYEVKWKKGYVKWRRLINFSLWTN